MIEHDLNNNKQQRMITPRHIVQLGSNDSLIHLPLLSALKKPDIWSQEVFPPKPKRWICLPEASQKNAKYTQKALKKGHKLPKIKRKAKPVASLLLEPFPRRSVVSEPFDLEQTGRETTRTKIIRLVALLFQNLLDLLSFSLLNMLSKPNQPCGQSMSNTFCFATYTLGFTIMISGCICGLRRSMARVSTTNKKCSASCYLGLF